MQICKFKINVYIKYTIYKIIKSIWCLFDRWFPDSCISVWEYATTFLIVYDGKVKQINGSSIVSKHKIGD